jgi:TldD protein
VGVASLGAIHTLHALTPRALWALPALDLVPAAGDPALAALAAAALDAATSAGATYADVRFTKTRTLRVQVSKRAIAAPRELDAIAVGVRVLVGNAWGFVASPEWTTDGVARVARAAAEQARSNQWATAQPVTLGDPPTVKRGTWTTPITQDPFTVAVDDQVGLLLAAHDTILDKPNVFTVGSSLSWQRQEKTFASTDGVLLTQTLYLALDNAGASVMLSNGSRFGFASHEAMQATGAGYEAVLDAKLEEAFPRLYEEAHADLLAPAATDAEAGRYDVVCDAHTVALLVNDTVGEALQLDRAVGDEANAAGTSYLAPPEDMLGKMHLSSEAVTIMANRSQPKGAATVKWDDEGFTPVDYTLIDQGVVTDYETSRPQAAWLASWYAQQRRAVRTHGDADAPDAFSQTMQHVPNLVLAPAPGAATFETLVSQVKKGIAVRRGTWVFDQQVLTGSGFGRLCEIVDGTLGRPINDGQLAVRAPELWKHLVALGGAASARVSAPSNIKGEPVQRTVHSVTAVPARFTEVTMTNAGRRGL